MALPLAGALIKASDLAAIFPVGVDAWATYLPTFTQGVAITNTVTRAAYMKVGRMVTVRFSLAATSAGTAGQPIRVGLPVAELSTAAVTGHAWIYDASATTRTTLEAFGAAAQVAGFVADVATAGVLGVNPAITIASGDLIDGEFSYEAAS